MKLLNSFIILADALGLGAYSASNRNEYPESSWGVRSGRRVRSSEKRLCGKCVSLEVSQTCQSPRPVSGIALLCTYVYFSFISIFYKEIISCDIVTFVASSNGINDIR
jgi:hypothetical protein